MTPQLVARALAIAQSITMSESAHLKHCLVLQELVLAAADAGRREVSVTLDVAAWLAIIDEVKGRRPRNLSQLVTETLFDRLGWPSGRE